MEGARDPSGGREGGTECMEVRDTREGGSGGREGGRAGGCSVDLGKEGVL